MGLRWFFSLFLSSSSSSSSTLLRLAAQLLLTRWVVPTYFAAEARFQYEKCAPEQGGGYCPGGNTCCPSEGTGRGGGCIPSDLGSYRGTCCYDDRGDDDDDGGDSNTWWLTGCGVGYRCGPNGTCLLRNDSDNNQDSLVGQLPRYRLCRQARDAPPPLFGFPVDTSRSDLKLAYYSSHGEVLDVAGSHSMREKVEVVLVMIHGALRNADDYFCTAIQAATDAASVSKTWVIAPLFAFLKNGTSDDDLSLANGGMPLRWGDEVLDPWRSGANALVAENSYRENDGNDDYSLSSYQALDRLLTHLVGGEGKDEHCKPLLPHLRRVVVAGHSSGGQYVQRWSLMTPVWDLLAGSSRRSPGRLNEIEVRSVVANPSSYAYLHPLRWDGAKQSWGVPDTEVCPGYNRWQWGLEGDGEHVHAAKIGVSPVNPYVRHQLRSAGGIERLIERFRQRTVVYLAGSQDRCNMSGTDDRGWCDSHGLESSCMDLLQGLTRWERFHHYISGLKLVELDAVGRVVQGVGHDHSLIFQSPEGIRALFGLIDDNNDGSRLTTTS